LQVSPDEAKQFGVNNLLAAACYGGVVRRLSTNLVKERGEAIFCEINEKLKIQETVYPEIISTHPSIPATRRKNLF